MGFCEMTGDQKPSLAPYAVRFALIYVALGIAAMVFFMVVPLKLNAGVGIGVVMGAAFGTGIKFLQQQKRLLRTGEALVLSFYSLMVVVVINSLSLVLTLYLNEHSLIPPGPTVPILSELPIELLLTGIAVMVPIYFAGLFVLYRFVLKINYNGMVKRGQL
jgi:hypothetical protein